MLFLYAAVLFAIIHGAESSPIVAPKQMTGLVGGSITVKCFYSTVTKANKYARKFWCKETPHRRSCDVVVSSTGFIGSKYRNRASLSDSPENNFFKVEMSSLNFGDIGYYRCGIGLTTNGLFATVSVAVSDDSSVPREAELVYGQLRGQVVLSCLFGSQHSAERKYLCKINKSGCSNIIDSTGKVAAGVQGRVMLSYPGTTGSFTVHMINLKKDDAGHYSCGAGKYGEFGDSQDIDLRISEETTIPQGRSLLMAPVGGSIAAECHYDPRVQYTSKYWCKWRDHGCTQLINEGGFVKEDMEGRLTLHDNSTSGTLTILMNQLTEGDNGWYWCAFASEENEYRSTVQVQITHDKPGLAVAEIVTVAPGRPVRIPCLYPCKYNSHQKYWCKWKSEGCDPVTCTDEGQSMRTISCDTQTKEFLLSITSASQHDEGWYWCGVRKDSHYGETVAVHLKVSEAARSNEPRPPLSDNGGAAGDSGVPGNNGNGGSARRNRIDFPSDPANGAITASPQDSKSSHLLPILLSLSAVVLLVAGALLVIRLRARKHSDLVSVGSFRTNISLSELDNNTRSAGKDNIGVVDAQETEMGKEEQKKAKKGSKEDLAYMSCLIHSEGTPQGSSS